MKKYFYVIAALSIAPTFALAQSIDSEVDSELDQISTQQVSSRQQPMMQAQQPIYILNQGAPSSASAVSNSNSQATQNQNQGQLQAQASEQQQVQKQPTTLIESTPLSESRAEQIRKARQDAELQTEQKIVEKLEASRMEDEKKRANILFGDRIQPVQQAPAPIVQAPIVQQPVYVQPAPVVPVQQVNEYNEENTRDLVREELRAAKKIEEDIAPTAPESRYFGALVGIGDYPEVRNVKGNYSLGAQFGTNYDGMILEGTFMYSNYNVDQFSSDVWGNYTYGKVDVNQYSGSLAAKYEFLSGMIRPIVGGLMSYSYRSFSWIPTYGGISNSDTATSHAVDVGVVTGVDLAFTPKFTLGLDFRYMFNMSSRVSTSSNSSFWNTSGQSGTPIEKLQYYVMSVVGKVTF